MRANGPIGIDQIYCAGDRQFIVTKAVVVVNRPAAIGKGQAKRCAPVAVTIVAEGKGVRVQAFADADVPAVVELEQVCGVR